MPVTVGAVLVAEPDRLSRGFALGPRVLARLAVLERGGFLTAGLPFGETARIALPPGEPLRGAKRRLRRALRIQGGELHLRDRNDAAPGLRRLLDQLEYFLSFIGLASLVAGGLGVSGAVSAFLERRYAAIATLKALGADGALTRNIYLIQIGATGGARRRDRPRRRRGGALADRRRAAKTSCPRRRSSPSIPRRWPAPAPSACLAAAAFALAPLARTRAGKPAALFRGEAAGRIGLERRDGLALAAGSGLALLTVATAPSPLVAAVMIAGVAAAFALLAGLGRLGAWAAGRLRRWARGPARIALANLAGPRSSAPRIAPAVGLGVGLLAAVILVQSSLLAEVREVAPRSAPALVFTDIPADRAAAFDAGPGAGLRPAADGERLSARSLRHRPHRGGARRAGRAGTDRGRRPLGLRQRHRALGARRRAGERGRDARRLVAGGLCRAAAGRPLHRRRPGREHPRRRHRHPRPARPPDRGRVAALRKVDFAAFGADFPVIVDAAALAGAGLSDMAMAKASPKEAQAATRALGAAFPQVGVISVREALEAVAGLFDRLSLAIRASSAIVAARRPAGPGRRGGGARGGPGPGGGDPGGARGEPRADHGRSTPWNMARRGCSPVSWASRWAARRRGW